MKTLPSILLVAIITAAWAAHGRCEWQTYTVSDGLVDNDVSAILEDRSGNLWFGTGDFWSEAGAGVCSFDGVSWITYTTEDGLADDLVQAIFEDRQGNLWFGTGDYLTGNGGSGVSRFDGVNWTTYTTEDGLVDNYVSEILEDSRGDLWFGGGRGSGVSHFDGVNWTTYTMEDGLADNTIQAITEDSNGNLWFATWYGGVSRFDGATWVTFTPVDGLAYSDVMAIVEDRQGVMWFGTWGGGVSRYDGVNWTTYTEADGLPSNHILAITEDSRGNLWFGTPYGVSRYDGVRWTTYTEEDGLADSWGGDYVLAITEDSHGNLWFAVRFGGVSRYDGVDWTTYTDADGLASNAIQAMVEDRDGNLWFGTRADVGVSCYDGVNWVTYTRADGLASNFVEAIAEDRDGNLWFGTWFSGVSRYDGSSWTTYTESHGLADNSVYTILADSHNNLWFGTGEGVSRYDGITWTTYTIADGVADNFAGAIAEDSKGNIWFGTRNGVSRYDGVTWTTYTTADGLADNEVRAIAEDHKGVMWFGTNGGGVSCYDGINWTTYTRADGVADNVVTVIIEDDRGILWFGAWYGGASCYDGIAWTTYTTEDGLANNSIQAIVEDRRGNLWFGTWECGVTLHRPDRVSPQTVIWPEPPRLSPNTIQIIAFAAAFGEVRGIVFSHSLNGLPWSEWSSLNSCTLPGLSDGEHVFRVRARDRVGNVDSIPATCTFEVDAAPPIPVITHPAFREAVRGSMLVMGTADDLRFREYVLEARAVGDSSWDHLARSQTPVVEDVLGTWGTEPLGDGDHHIRLSVEDTLGLTGIDLVRVLVDNKAPWAWETSPVVVSASSGGDVYTTNGEVHLYFSPHAFDEDVEVIVDRADLPDNGPEHAKIVHTKYRISWEAEELRKSAALDMALGDSLVVGESDEVMAVYVLPKGQEWRRLGGTVSCDERMISVPADCEGTYCLCTDGGGAGQGGGLSAISLAPRVFSHSGSFGSTKVAISFTVGRSGPVTVRVFNRAGRLVDEIVEGGQMNAGANVVHWDGRDGGGNEVPDGLYLVAVEAMGQTRVKTLAVVR